MLWFVYLNGRLRMGLQPFEQSQSVAVQCAGFKHEDGYVQAQAVDEVADDHVLCAQARGLFKRL